MHAKDCSSRGAHIHFRCVSLGMCGGMRVQLHTSYDEVLVSNTKI